MAGRRKLRVKHQADSKISSCQFNASKIGLLPLAKLDKDLVLDMQQLLELLDKTPSRFIPLGDGQFF